MEAKDLVKDEYYKDNHNRVVKYCGTQNYLGKTYHNFFESMFRLFYWLDPKDVTQIQGVEMKAILCYHHNYPKRIRPAPAIVIGQCKHNYSCPVCGSGRGQYPDPCDNKVGYTCPEDIGGGGKHFEHNILHKESNVT